VKFFTLLTVTAIFVSLPGCAYLGSQDYRHVIEDRTGTDKASATDLRVGTFALLAQRRMVLVKFSSGQFCAEPSPDAVDNLSSTFSAALAADSKSAEASAKVAGAAARYAKQLFYRSQGLQLYRDGLFALCVEHLNGAIHPDQMPELQRNLLAEAASLIRTEIPELKAIKADQGEAPGVTISPEQSIQATPPKPAASAAK